MDGNDHRIALHSNSRIENLIIEYLSIHYDTQIDVY